MLRMGLLLLVAVLGGCAVAPVPKYVAPPAETLTLSLLEARRTIRQTLMTYPSGTPSRPRACNVLDRVLFTEADMVTVRMATPTTPARRTTWSYRLFRPELILDEEGDTPLVMEVAPEGQGTQGRGYNMVCYVVGDVTADPVIHRLVDAMQVLKATAARPLPDFEAVVRSYRAEAVKPELPESARRWRVQAESAVRAQRFDEAADLFDAALAEAPWWPEGHFNRALVLGEAGDPSGAITEMRRYLALVPEAADARAAQDKIYEWEGQVTPPAPAAPAPAARR
jgi:hypothetical protein